MILMNQCAFPYAEVARVLYGRSNDVAANDGDAVTGHVYIRILSLARLLACLDFPKIMNNLSSVGLSAFKLRKGSEEFY